MIKKFFDSLFGGDESAPPTTYTLDLAAAALMVEVMKADHEIDPQEQSVLRSVLAELFDLSDTDTESLLQEATTASNNATDLFRFTDTVHEKFSEEQKFRLVVGLWKVAYASDGIDRYEEHIIRRIADLLYVPHSEFMRAKHVARADA
ncbi:MAG: TerB family tellurite resistance protein [Oceanobacter sp.]